VDPRGVGGGGGGGGGLRDLGSKLSVIGCDCQK